MGRVLGVREGVVGAGEGARAQVHAAPAAARECGTGSVAAAVDVCVACVAASLSFLNLIIEP